MMRGGGNREMRRMMDKMGLGYERTPKRPRGNNQDGQKRDYYFQSHLLLK